MGETTAVAHGGDPHMKALPSQDRAASLPRLMPIPQVRPKAARDCSPSRKAHLILKSFHY
ncbi:hypothetical protein [Moorena sp. SIO4G3]|uniref:hypothetical protein n=1 Tax=Moorena sp. SIO4G3 TaxID=2607821 RepID=UPI0025FF4244|nr:hypothetical protein [Moorena sp. SIO4G3]